MAPRSSKGGYYAVKRGRTPGVFNTWAECEAQTKGFPGSIYKKFPSLTEAEHFVAESSASSAPLTSTPVPPVASSTISAKPIADPKGKKRAFNAEVEDTAGWDIVYSDGACKGNGKVGSVAGIGVWWGLNDKRNIAERCPGDQTNNRAELIAIMRVLQTTPITKKPLLIRTDSQYSINCFRNWIKNWEAKNWKTSLGGDVKNAGIIRCIALYLDIRGRKGQKVVLEYVKGHSGDTGNDGADSMANIGATLPSLPEKDWATLEEELRHELASTDFHGEQVATTEIVGPSNDQSIDDLSPDQQIETKPSKKVRKTSSQPKPTITSQSFHQTITTTETIASPSTRSHYSKPTTKTTVVHSSSQETIKIRNSGPPGTAMNTQITKSSSHTHIMHNPEKQPLKVVYVDPSLLADNKKEVDLNLYADGWLPDDDLAHEFSD